MEKRYQVFVSSTYKDLIEERNSVIEALLKAKCFPAGMELFPASNRKLEETIIKTIDLCDYFIVVVGGRFGTRFPGRDISYTQWEYEHAESKGIPTLPFLSKKFEELPSDKVEKDKDLKGKLKNFRGLLEMKTPGFWTSPGELHSAVTLSIKDEIQNSDRPGWIRGGHVVDSKLENQLDELRNDKEIYMTISYKYQGDSIHLGGHANITFETTPNEFFMKIAPLFLQSKLVDYTEALEFANTWIQMKLAGTQYNVKKKEIKIAGMRVKTNDIIIDDFLFNLSIIEEIGIIEMVRNGNFMLLTDLGRHHLARLITSGLAPDV